MGRFADVVHVLPAGAGARRHAGVRLPARRRHFHALRAEPAPDRQECRAVGDVPGLHGGLGVLLLQLPLQRDLPVRGAQARRRDPHHQPDRRRRLRHRRADPEAPDRGGRAPVRYRGLEGLRQAAGEPRPGRPGRAGRDREILRAADGGAPPRHRPAAGAHRHRAERAGGPGRQEGVAGRGAVPAQEPSVRAWPPSTASTRASSTPRPRRSTPSAWRAWPRTAASKAR